MPAVQRPPGLKFLHVLQHDHPGPYFSRPPQGYPCKSPDIFILWLPSLGLAEMLAVWRKPRQCYRMPLTGFYRVNIPDALTIMLCVRMVRFVHPDSFRVMVNGDVHAYPGCQFYASAGSAATGEIINYQLSIDHGATSSKQTHLTITLFFPLDPGTISPIIFRKCVYWTKCKIMAPVR